MPRLTKKEEAIRHWTEVLRHRNAKKLLRIGEDDEFEDFLDNYVATQLRKCQHQRFLQRSAYRKMEEFTKMEFSLDLRSSEDDSEGNMRGQPQFLRDAEFLQQYRMSKASLRKLTSKIEKHEVFRQGSRGPKQPPPIYQLMVLLRYLGTDGSGASLPSLRARYKFSAGTARNHKMRALKAVLSLSSEYYRWPDPKERRQIANRFKDEYGWPNLVAICDGTLNPLLTKPETSDYSDYSGRKHQYSLSTLIFNDDKRRIRYFLAGWPGCSHDNRVFRNSNLYRNPTQYFTESEYSIADSALEPQPFMVPGYRKPVGGSLQPEHEKFNAELARPRVLSEHTIGLWKNRFPWLRSIRAKITMKKRSLMTILAYIEATVILHNFLIEENEEWDDDDKSETTTVGSYKSVGDDGLSTWQLSLDRRQISEKDIRRRQLVCYINDNFL